MPTWIGLRFAFRAPPGVPRSLAQRPFRDAEKRDKVRESLASIGFGNGPVDQPLTIEPGD